MHSDFFKRECTNCGNALKVSEHTCRKCGNIERDRIPNIDFWHLVWKLIESPGTSLLQAAQAEKKNFTLPVALLISVKISLLMSLIRVHVYKTDAFSPLLFLTAIGTSLGVIFVSAVLLMNIYPLFRLKDTFSVIVFANLPLLIAFVLLFIPEFVIFGQYIFLASPSPFLLDFSLAMTFSVLELIFLIWSAFCLFRGVRFISGKMLVPLLFSLLFYVLMFVSILWKTGFVRSLNGS